MPKRGTERATDKSKTPHSAPSRNQFKTLTVQANQAETVVKLLFSPEISIVNDAIIALNRYGIQALQSLIELYQCGILEALLHLLNRPNQEILRFTIKLLASLIQIPEARQQLESNSDFLEQLSKFLNTTNDEVLHEYSTYLLADLTHNLEICKYLNGIGILPDVWKHVYNQADLDTTNAALKIIRHLLDVNETVNQLFAINTFRFQSIIIYFMSEYVELQFNSLDLFKKIVACADNQDIHEFLVGTPQTFNEIFKVIEHPFIDRQPLCFEILKELLVTEATIMLFIQNEMLPKLLGFAEETKNISLSFICADIITQIAEIENGRHELYVMCVDKFILKLLFTAGGNDNLASLKACQAINVMVRHPKAVKSFTDLATLQAIIPLIFTKEGNCWLPDRAYVIEALTHIMWSDSQIPEYLTSPSLFQYLLDTLGKNASIMPIEYFRKFLHLFHPFVLCQKWYSCILKTNFLQLLAQQLDHDSDSIKITALELLGSYMCDSASIDWCLQSKTYEKPLKFLESTNTLLVQAAITFLDHLSRYEAIALLYVDKGVLKTLLSRQKEFEYFPIWKRAIRKLLNVHLPTKFNMTGRLDVLDVTKDNFYVSRRPVSEFPILQEMNEQLACPMNIFYVLSLTQEPPPLDKIAKLFSQYDMNDAILETIPPLGVQLQRIYQPCKFKPIKDPLPSTASQIARPDKVKREIFYQRYRPLSEFARIRARDAGQERDSVRVNDLPEIPSETILAELIPRLLSWIGKIPPDPYIGNYIKEVRKVFQTDAFAKDGSPIFRKLVNRVEFLAQYVVCQTAGPEDNELYLTPAAQLEHLNQLKKKFGTTMLPLGYIRIGGYFERAVLYKVLADQLSIPCSLVRGEMGRAWNEVPLIGNALDPKYTRTGLEGPVAIYIVDLMDFPGRLYPIKTSYARDYCNP